MTASFLRNWLFPRLTPPDGTSSEPASTSPPTGPDPPVKAKRVRRKRAAQPPLPLHAQGPRADFTCAECGVVELSVTAKFCPTCGGPLERQWSANIVSKPVVKTIGKMLDAAPARIDAPKQSGPEAILTDTVYPEHARATMQAALSAGRMQSAQFGTILDTSHSTAPVPNGQSPRRQGHIRLPKPRPLAGQSLMDGDTAKSGRYPVAK